jgi:hypothetical protein
MMIFCRRPGCGREEPTAPGGWQKFYGKTKRAEQFARCERESVFATARGTLVEEPTVMGGW